LLDQFDARTADLGVDPGPNACDGMRFADAYGDAVRMAGSLGFAPPFWWRVAIKRLMVPPETCSAASKSPVRGFGMCDTSW